MQWMNRLLAVGLLTLAQAAVADDVLGPGAFSAKVREAGGAVDFAFGAERPFAQCHASTVVQAANGDILAAWFAGTKEKHPDVGIWFGRLHDKKWSEPTRIAKVNETAHWNPVLFRDQDNVVYLFFKVGPEIEAWQTYWMQSTDNGETWTEPKELVPGDHGGRGPVRSAPIVLSDGSWLAPASTELKGWKSFADRSEDKGLTWNRSVDFEADKGELGGRNCIQPTLWESEPGHVHALLRTMHGFIWKVESKDFGKTWEPITKTTLPNNNSGVEALRLPDGRVILCYNPVTGNWAARTPIDLAITADNGATWKTIAHLEDDADIESEFSYPSMKLTDDGVVITYTWQRDRVRCWRIPLSVFEGK
jgi:predicted neuraminidase